MWLGLTLLSALLLAGYDLAKKHAVRANAVMPVLFLATLSGALFCVAALAAAGRLGAAAHLDPADHARVACKAVIVAASWICVFHAMRALPISIVAPIRGSAPLWTLAGAIVLFGEMPSWRRGAGMAAVLAGYALFSWAGRAEGIDFRRHRGVWLLALGTLLGAASALYDKHLLQGCRLPPDALQFWFSLWLVVLTGLAWMLQRGTGLDPMPFAWRASIPVVGVALVLADWLYFHALAGPGVAISVVSLLRRSNVVVSFAVGARLFGEGNLRRKGLALAVILAGVVVLCLAR